jgi:activator of 2-hydroxyglutaryl-CoA dehydratase/predicted nucleotide-binding protein (sugar kinase/HSP70/actin superfamily)
MDPRLYIDAGIEYIKFGIFEINNNNQTDVCSEIISIPCNDQIEHILALPRISSLLGNIRNRSTSIYITGKLAEIVHRFIGSGQIVMSAAAIWSAAKFYLKKDCNFHAKSLSILDLSASGYTMICIDRNGELKNDLLIVNPRCGAGTGVNLNRILEKLDIKRDAVDHILSDYLGDAGSEKRREIPVRSDRCGVFSSSATISDKNQGIPLDYALAITMKSEVNKSCEKMLSGVDAMYLTGGVFRWQYARDCAQDILKAKDIKNIFYDEAQSLFIDGLHHLTKNIGDEKLIIRNTKKLRKESSLISIPPFKLLHDNYEKLNLYKRMDEPVLRNFSAEEIEYTSLSIGLDIGSTMAKVVICDSNSGEILLMNSCNNHGDTIDTVKYIFKSISQKGIKRLKIQHIGITGSGRYQVQKALKAVYPHLEDRISVMVENYAHVHGSSQLAREHLKKLKEKKNRNVNEDYCLLVDIGGEDTKISVIALNKNDLFDNAMNVKCSAGTGSLMDTLSAMFGIKNIKDAYQSAYISKKAYGINATCAVFLMENARKMQAEGFSQETIFASCSHAIVENMVRSLWDQVEFPKNSLVLLHGQTMLSEPLPLAVTHRIQEYTGEDTYCLVPPYPGHRACLGLIESMRGSKTVGIETYTFLDDLLKYQFEKRVIICRGAVCGDKNSRCARTKLSSVGMENNFSLTLGGCTAVNEFKVEANSDKISKSPDAYGDIWKFINNQLPKSTDTKRLVIPRSFAISEMAYVLSRIFTHLGIPVHVDNVQERDILEGQPLFSIDTCAPNIGATGQFIRLANEPHGMILVPQIEFLPTDGDSLGRTCTTNQGGVQIAKHNAESIFPNARFYLFDISFEMNDVEFLVDQMHPKFSRVFDYYEVKVSKGQLKNIIYTSLEEYEILKVRTADLAADYIQTAIDNKLNISIVSAREYILNPGIYDSHVGKLLKDKGVVAIPSYVFEAMPDKQFDFIYWKNPHSLLSKVNSIVNKEFHKVINNERLSKIIKLIENGDTETKLSVVTVSTFRCGPDTITLPIEAEVTKNHPTLLIQSDAMIAELAHLENRVNTHLNQLKNSLHDGLKRENGEGFSIEILNNLNLNGQNRDECILYIPTMGDNRVLSTVFRAAGFTTIDNFDDASFNLEQKVKTGRKYLGDSVCVPLSAVYSDMLQAIEDFKTRKKMNDPKVKDKDKIILFMQTGDGPCRQGQYLDLCKLGVYKNFVEANSDIPIKFLSNTTTSLHTEKDFLSELEKWASLQVYHVIIIKDVLHSLFLKYVSNCVSFSDYEKFIDDYQGLKTEVYRIIENEMKPGRFAETMANFVEKKIPFAGGVAKYLFFGFYNNNGLRKVLRRFNQKWSKIITCLDPDASSKPRIYVDGEIYLRVAQIEEIIKLLIDLRGFNWFNLSYAPMWSYFEYIVEQRIVLAQEQMEKFDEALRSDISSKEQSEIINKKRSEAEKIADAEYDSKILRNILALPLYKAAGVKMPHPIRDHISEARKIVPTLKPEGELIPYIGATISEINDGTDLILNLAPEGCMVASMGEMLSPAISKVVNGRSARIQHMSSTDGEINEEILNLALLKMFGPVDYYKSTNGNLRQT